MHRITRRAMIVGVASSGLATSALADSAASIEGDVDAALKDLFGTVPGSQELAARARGVLIMPKVIKGGLIIGGAYGEGALRIGGVTDSYYSFAAGSIGYQIGVQRTAHALFFMTENALEGFRSASGWELGADAEFTVPGDGISLSIDSTSAKQPVIAMVFAQDGLLAGASLGGGKYSRVNR